jgi:Lon protease-like protein
MGASSRARPLPTEFPIFPLPGAMLLPAGRLPLNIFEPRYLAMVEDALGHERVIGMIQPDPTRAATPTGPSLYRIGCLGRITSFSETDDGRYLITLSGLSRFAVSVELEMVSGYRRVRADLDRFARDLEPAPDADPGAIQRETLLRALRAYFTSRGFDANWEAIDEMADEPLVSTLSMVCPFEPAEKQVLLEAPTTADRGRALLALLEIGAHLSEPGDNDRKLS